MSVNRALLILVGSGAAGKTTLVCRLRDKKFAQNFGMTDGIEMSRFPLCTTDGAAMKVTVEFTVFDFAGQKEYVHTHAIFFKKNAIYLVLINPRTEGTDHEQLENYLQMIKDVNPDAVIILVATRATEYQLTTEHIDDLRRNHPNICEIFSVDSMDGKGIPELEQSLVTTALNLNGTIQEVPRDFFSLEKKLTSYADENSAVFSLSASAFVAKSLEWFPSLGEENAHLALKLFVWWGFVHVLSNGDVVLRPQQLADVLACVVTKKPETLQRIGEPARSGSLKHDDASLNAVWGGYDDRLWKCNGATRDSDDADVVAQRDEEGQDADGEAPVLLSAFLDLLHQSGLAFPLYDVSGVPKHISLVPAMLHELPHEHKGATESVDLYKHFFGDFLSGFSEWQYEIVTLRFKRLPSTFLARLLVRLCNVCVQDGCWLHGCAVATRTGNDEHSFALVHQFPSRPHEVDIVMTGCNRSARSIVIVEIMNLLKDVYPSVEIINVDLTYGNKSRGKNDIIEAMRDEGYLELGNPKVKIPLQSLQSLFPGVDLSSVSSEISIPATAVGGSGFSAGKELKNLSTSKQVAKETDAAYKLDKVDEPVISAPVVDIVKQNETNISKGFEVDLIAINSAIQNSIPTVLKLARLDGSVAGRAKAKLHALWLVLCSTSASASASSSDSTTESTNAGSDDDTGNTVTPSKVIAIPLTPGGRPEAPWRFVKRAAVTIDPGDRDVFAQWGSDRDCDVKVHKGGMAKLPPGLEEFKEAVKRSLCLSSKADDLEDLAEFPDDFESYDILVTCNLSKHLKKLVRVENDNFEDFNGLAICYKFAPERRS